MSSSTISLPVIKSMTDLVYHNSPSKLVAVIKGIIVYVNIASVTKNRVCWDHPTCTRRPKVFLFSVNSYVAKCVLKRTHVPVKGHQYTL